MFIKTKNFGPHGNTFGIKFSCFPHEGVSGYKSLHGSVFSKFGTGSQILLLPMR